MAFDEQNDGIIVKRRSGTRCRPLCLDRVSHKIINNKIELSEIPNQFNHVNVKYNGVNLTEVYYKSPDNNQYNVDYANGFVEFNEAQDGLTVDVEYYGTGVNLFPSSRVYLNEDVAGISASNLQDYANETNDRITNLEWFLGFTTVQDDNWEV